MSEPKERSVKFSFAERPEESEPREESSPNYLESATPAVNHVDPTSQSQKAPTKEKKKDTNRPPKKASFEDVDLNNSAAARDVIGDDAPRPRFIFCDECQKNIPVDEWPDHRDRLRQVNLVEQVTTVRHAFFRLLGGFLMWMLRNVYFREVTLVGEENVPNVGATVFYGNHQNQFVDALMLNSSCGREVRFLMAEKSFNQPIIGSFGRIFNSVPVIRPQDVPLTPGAGKLVKMEGVTVTGKGTAFTTCMSKGDVIFWVTDENPKCRAQVSRVHSDTEVEVTILIPEELSVSKPTDFKISRRIDHSEMYGQVYNTLQNNHCIGIFPEGGSHDHTSLLPLKAGVALFSLGAAERNIPVKIVPCGLTYLYGHKFRSRAYLEFGEPITPSDELVELFGHDKRAATGLFLEQLNDALRAVTINVPDWATLKLLHSFRQLYTPPNCTLSAKDYLRLTRRLSVIIEKHSADPEFNEFRERVAAYKDFCAALLVRDSQVATLARLGGGTANSPQIRLLLRRLFAIFLMGVILVPFFVLGVPVGIFLEYYSSKKARAAFLASKVKVVGADVRGSFKILAGFVLIPVDIMLISFIIFLYTDARTALVIGFSLPMAMYVSLLILQELVMELRAALPQLMSLMSNHKQFKKLYEKRQQLAEMATAFVARFDPVLEKEMQVYSEVADDVGDLGAEPSLFSLRYNVRRRQATNA